MASLYNIVEDDSDEESGENPDFPFANSASAALFMAGLSDRVGIPYGVAQVQHESLPTLHLHTGNTSSLIIPNSKLLSSTMKISVRTGPGYGGQNSWRELSANRRQLDINIGSGQRHIYVETRSSADHLAPEVYSIKVILVVSSKTRTEKQRRKSARGLVLWARSLSSGDLFNLERQEKGTFGQGIMEGMASDCLLHHTYLVEGQPVNRKDVLFLHHCPKHRCKKTQRPRLLMEAERETTVVAGDDGSSGDNTVPTPDPPKSSASGQSVRLVQGWLFGTRGWRRTAKIDRLDWRLGSKESANNDGQAVRLNRAVRVAFGRAREGGRAVKMKASTGFLLASCAAVASALFQIEVKTAADKHVNLVVKLDELERTHRSVSSGYGASVKEPGVYCQAYADPHGRDELGEPFRKDKDVVFAKYSEGALSIGSFLCVDEVSKLRPDGKAGDGKEDDDDDDNDDDDDDDDGKADSDDLQLSGKGGDDDDDDDDDDDLEPGERDQGDDAVNSLKAAGEDGYGYDDDDDDEADGDDLDIDGKDWGEDGGLDDDDDYGEDTLSDGHASNPSSKDLVDDLDDGDDAEDDENSLKSGSHDSSRFDLDDDEADADGADDLDTGDDDGDDDLEPSGQDENRKHALKTSGKGEDAGKDLETDGGDSDDFESLDLYDDEDKLDEDPSQKKHGLHS
ncbi:hypothetical protein PAAG_03384 [Paracoccidioides lutzii Pb01]|uniref:Uncharacterized protein n=1 Tax=Paracoccidioides lutzii (strain ATCC MYA-826 / Pb01) TaxID=502779 RepID=C1GX10_PARBA|nr:hypothetical protein PAAG_03384 [Paracoccidioides lutzii Pb01]EEH41098.2 hypothetical protein PAAG_03384 [Paracoccidioides lutzii Pb01]